MGSGWVCFGWGHSQWCVCLSLCSCVCDGEHVCEPLSLCWPCRAPACLSGSHWSIMLSECREKSHYSETTQHISGRAAGVSPLCCSHPSHPWMQMSCLQCPASQIAYPPVWNIFWNAHQLPCSDGWMQTSFLSRIPRLKTMFLTSFTLTGDLLMQVHMQLCSCRLLTSLRQEAHCCPLVVISWEVLANLPSCLQKTPWRLRLKENCLKSLRSPWVK